MAFYVTLSSFLLLSTGTNDLKQRHTQLLKPFSGKNFRPFHMLETISFRVCHINRSDHRTDQKVVFGFNKTDITMI